MDPFCLIPGILFLQSGALDESVLTDRNETRELFCDAVKQCAEKCEQLQAEERRHKLNVMLISDAEFPTLDHKTIIFPLKC